MTDDTPALAPVIVLAAVASNTALVELRHAGTAREE